MPKPSENLGFIPDGADAETYDKLRRRVLWKMPYGIYVVGVRDGEKLNAMTLNFASQVSTDPKLIAISIWKEAITHEMVANSKAFSLCTIPREEKAVVRKFVKPVEADLEAMTLNGFEYFIGTTGSPVLKVAASYIECTVSQVVEVGDHSLFIGEVVYADFLGEEDTPVLRMEDTSMNYGG